MMNLVALIPIACAVCFSGEDANRIAYIATTGFLTFLPLTMVGLGLWMGRRYIVRRSAEIDAVTGIGTTSES